MLMKKYLGQPNNLIRDVSYLDDNTSCSLGVSSIKYKTDFLLFRPEGHYGNAISLLKSLRKKLSQQYFGTDKHPENPFRNCKTPKEIFNLSRNIKFDLKMKLSRMGFILLKNGEVSVLHKGESIIPNNLNIQQINKDFIAKHELTKDSMQDDKFSKHDYFLSAEMFEGIISSNNFIQKGISIKCLGEKKVYTYYGVFNPTRQDYINLVDSYLKDNIRDLKTSVKSCVDLGCGTGILSLMLSFYGLPRIFSLDKSENAILACKTNSQAFGYFDNIKPIKFDIVDNYQTEKNIKKSTVNNQLELDKYIAALKMNK